jgi:hypothetical protein
VSEVFEEVLREYAQIPADFQAAPIQVPASEREGAERMFREQMRTYDSHWRDDPYFDSTNTLRAAPHLPCPLADHDLLMRTARYAVQGNFGWPRPRTIDLTFDALARLQPLLAAEPATRGDQKAVGIQVTGQGGGDFTILLADERPVAAQPGIASRCRSTYFLNSAVFQALVENEITVDEAVYSGAVVIEGDSLAEHPPTTVLRSIVTALSA